MEDGVECEMCTFKFKDGVRCVIDPTNCGSYKPKIQNTITRMPSQFNPVPDEVMGDKCRDFCDFGANCKLLIEDCPTARQHQSKPDKVLETIAKLILSYRFYSSLYHDEEITTETAYSLAKDILYSLKAKEREKSSPDKVLGDTVLTKEQAIRSEIARRLQDCHDTHDGLQDLERKLTRLIKELEGE